MTAISASTFPPLHGVEGIVFTKNVVVSGLSGDLARWGDRILTGTGLSLSDAALVAGGAKVPAGVPDACAGALRDGWAAAVARVELEDAALPESDTPEGGGES